jgi:hypothetical protein
MREIIKKGRNGIYTPELLHRQIPAVKHAGVCSYGALHAKDF